MNKKDEILRSAKVVRKTRETDVNVDLTLDGTGEASVSTGIAFFDHMLTLVAAHGFFDLSIKAKGDIEVDEHHTVEDVGIVLGEAFAKALGDRKGIRRYGTGIVPMDESLACVVADFSNRPFLVYRVNVGNRVGSRFDLEHVREFFSAFANRSGTTLHINLLYGENTHHIIEAIFKAFGQALDMASGIDQRVKGVRSTKGVL